MVSDPPKVLISYSHDSPEHAGRVLELANRLRGDGIDCMVDQYVVVPEDGWPLWMEKQIRDSDFILMVCTETYLKRVLGEEQPGKGFGVRWEGNLIYNVLYRAQGINTKFIPLLFGTDDASNVPTPLQGRPVYEPLMEAGYEDLYRRLTDQPSVIKAELGKLRSLPVKERQSEGAYGRLVNVPNLPTHFIPRQDALEELKDALMTGLSNPVALTGAGKIGVQGMGGVGKSVLAAAVARDDEVRHAFPDGVIWITLSQTPGNLTGRQAQLAEALGESTQAFADVQRGKSRLSVLLERRCCLLILDDVWQVEHAAAFDALGERGRMLITTRDARIVTGLGAIDQRVDPLTEPQALTLLAQWSGSGDPERLPDVAKEVARECGYLPLALAIAGARAKGDQKGWANVLHRLRHADLAKLRGQFPDYPYEDLLKAIDASVEALALEGWRDRYLDLAVFPEDVPMPEASLYAFWEPLGMDEYEVQDALERLVNLSLLRRDDQNRYTLHDLQYDYVRNEGVRKQAGVESLTALNGRFLEAYAKRCPDGWPSGPKDGYYFERLPWHLKAAGRNEELKQLLCNFEWLQQKLDATSPNALIADYDFLTAIEKDSLPLSSSIKSAARLVGEALRLSATALAANPAELPGQLHGRLLGFEEPDIRRLLDQAAQSRSGVWLRPLTRNLVPPGSPLITTLTEPRKSVTAIAFSPDGGTVVFASRPRDPRSASDPEVCDVKVWRVDSGDPVFTLCRSRVDVLAVSPCGAYAAIATGGRGTLLSIAAVSGQAPQPFDGLPNPVVALSFSEGGKSLVAVSAAGEVQIWDITCSPPNLARSKDLSRAFATRDALFRRPEELGNVDVAPVAGALFVGLEGWPRVGFKEWRIEDGQPGLSVSTGVDKIAVTPDASKILAAESVDVAVWTRGPNEYELAFRLPRNAFLVTALAISPDGRRAAVASFDDLKIWSLSKDQTYGVLSEREDIYPNSVVTASNGRKAVALFNNGEARVWDLGMLQPQNPFHVPGARELVFSVPEGSLVGCDHPQGLLFQNLDNGESRVVHAPAKGICVAVTPDGSRAFTASDDGKLIVWEIATGRVLQALDAHREGGVAAFPDGRCAVVTAEYSIAVWDLASGRQLRTLKGHTYFVDRLAVSRTPAGWRIASGSRDCTVRIWDPERTEPLFTLTGHTYTVSDVQTLADRERVLSCCSDGTLRLWNMLSGKQEVMFTTDSKLLCCACSPDDKTIVAGDLAGRMHFFALVGTLPVGTIN